MLKQGTNEVFFEFCVKFLVIPFRLNVSEFMFLESELLPLESHQAKLCVRLKILIGSGRELVMTSLLFLLHLA